MNFELDDILKILAVIAIIIIVLALVAYGAGFIASWLMWEVVP